MKVKIICVGKLKEKYLVAGVNEYIKRLKGYCKVEMYEVADESIPDNCSFANEIIIKNKEGRKILDKIKQDDYVILLDVAGNEIDSIELSKQMESCMIKGKSTIDFVIGGSLGHGSRDIRTCKLSIEFFKDDSSSSVDEVGFSRTDISSI